MLFGLGGGLFNILESHLRLHNVVNRGITDCCSERRRALIEPWMVTVSRVREHFAAAVAVFAFESRVGRTRKVSDYVRMRSRHAKLHHVRVTTECITVVGSEYKKHKLKKEKSLDRKNQY